MPTLTSLIPKNIIIPDDIYMYIIKLYFNKYVIPECIEYVECRKDRLEVFRNEWEWPSKYEPHQEQLNDMYNAITDEKLWPFFGREDSFHYCSIWDEMRMQRILEHPLVSKYTFRNVEFYWCIKILRSIAMNGWSSILEY